MKKLLLLAVICLLASASQVSAQLLIKNTGNAEVGQDCFDPENTSLPPAYLNWLDTVTVLTSTERLEP